MLHFQSLKYPYKQSLQLIVIHTKQDADMTDKVDVRTFVGH